jgi:sugar lactone lactonase YvrE
MRFARHVAVFVILLAGVAGPAAAACTARILASSYNGDNVYVYDACTGAFERLLDDQNRINGPQAVILGPDDLIYVVSEENQRILRYDAETLAFRDTFITLPANTNPTGIAIGGGKVYVCGYRSDDVRRYDLTTGAFEATVVPANSAVLNGPDNGMIFGPDGRLYIPGYDNSVVVAYDPRNGQTSSFIASRAGGLRNTRGILFESNGNVLVASENSLQILRYSSAGAFIGVFAENFGRAAGMNFLPDGSIAVATNSDWIAKVSADGTVTAAVESGLGGLNSTTYAAVIPKSGIDQASIGSQYWIAGNTSFTTGRVLEFDAITGTGGAFGADFVASQVQIRPWGRMRIEFTGCRAATLSWTSASEGGAGFGDFGYPLSILVPTPFTTQCEAQPFAQVTGLDWINGTWWGGASRAGEGVLITRAGDGTTFVAFFTHRPMTL